MAPATGSLTRVDVWAVAAAAALSSHASDASHAADGVRPNLILILADDLGAKELGCYGSREHRTPNLDRMATEGVRFETFYAMPKCTPTRMALMTGQYGFHNGYLGMENKAFVLAKDSPQKQIANHFTHAKLLQSSGYATALSGKWQLSGELPRLVYEAGFDDYRMWAYARNLPPGVTHPAMEKGPGSNTSHLYRKAVKARDDVQALWMAEHYLSVPGGVASPPGYYRNRRRSGR